MKPTSSLVYQHMLWRGLYFLSVLLINIGIARFFAAEQSGQIFFIVNNLALVLLIASISLESGATFYISSGGLEAGLMANFCAVWANGASLIALAGWWIYLGLTHSAYLTNPGFPIASFLFILGVLFTSYFTALFYAKKEFGLPNKILFTINLLFIVLLVAAKNNPVFRTSFIEIYFFSFFLQGFVIRLFFFRRYATGSRFMFPTNDILKKVFRYSLIALMANLIYFLVNRIDYWFVQYYCSSADLGNYIQASKLAQMLFILPSILGATLFPVFSSLENKGNEKQLATAMRVLLIINSGICFLIACVGWFVFPLVFGATFENMYVLFLFLIPGILSITLTYPLTAWFSGARQLGTNVRGSLLALIVICIGDRILLPVYGISTAPVVCSTGYFCYYCYMVTKFRKEYAFSWKEFLLIKSSDLNRILQSMRKNFREPVPENPIV